MYDRTQDIETKRTIFVKRQMEIEDMEELDSCLLSFPKGMSSFGEPRFCLGNVEYLGLFILVAGVDVMPPLIKSKSLMSPASSLY